MTSPSPVYSYHESTVSDSDNEDVVESSVIRQSDDSLVKEEIKDPIVLSDSDEHSDSCNDSDDNSSIVKKKRKPIVLFDSSESTDSCSDSDDDNFMAKKKKEPIVLSDSNESTDNCNDSDDDNFMAKKKKERIVLSDSNESTDNCNDSDNDNFMAKKKKEPIVLSGSNDTTVNEEGEVMQNLSDPNLLVDSNGINEKNDVAESYFDADTQLAILASLEDRNSTNTREQDYALTVVSPQNNQSGIEIEKHASPNISNKFLDVTDVIGNKENLIGEKMRLEYEIKEVLTSISEKRETLNTVNVDMLPDKGVKLKISLERELRCLDSLNEQLNRVKNQLKPTQKTSNMKEDVLKFSSLPSANLQDMGEKALENHRVEQALTVDALRHLHKSLNACPSENVTVSDPTGLKIPLMEHQKQALAWLIWRENEKPSGGVLADDMGLGKTLTMISLVLKRNEEGLESADENDDSIMETITERSKYQGGTLIVCPSSLIGQWESEIKQRVTRGLLTYEVHHGGKREKKARRLARPDIIITSYTIVRSEFQNYSKLGEKSMEALFSVKWKRVVLDEAHVIRNHKSKTAEAVCRLKASHRWALTGTPVHNKMQDFYALLKFLRCRPFNDLNIWKKWVEAKDETGSKRLNMLTKSLMLRRTKDVLSSEGKLESLPERSSETITIHLSEVELALYEEVSNFSKTLLSQLLYQRSQKDQLLSHGIQDFRNKKFNLPENENPFREHPALNKLYNRVKNMGNVKTHEILVLLLRLRQICCHPALMKSMIEKDAILQDEVEDEDGSDADLLEKISSLNVNEDGDVENTVQTENSQASYKNVFSLENPIYKPEWISSKIRAILQLLEENLLKTDDKIVIVSQWSSMLDIIYDFLKEYKNCKCESLTGKTPVDQRMNIVSEFNRSSSSIKILLLSLTAGGTGLNLVGGNHLILTDLHWNPQLEAQACDRIYRMGQKKPVNIYKFVCAETIEERILLLQNEKLALADGVLSGAKHLQASKLSLNDLKMLFSVK